jgi:hypothetical protein
VPANGRAQAVKLTKERGYGYVQAEHNWVKGFETDPQYAFPGHGQIEPEVAEDCAAAARSDPAEGGAGVAPHSCPD